MRPDFDGIDSGEIELLYQALETVDMEKGGSPGVLERQGYELLSLQGVSRRDWCLSDDDDAAQHPHLFGTERDWVTFEKNKPHRRRPLLQTMSRSSSALPWSRLPLQHEHCVKCVSALCGQV